MYKEYSGYFGKGAKNLFIFVFQVSMYNKLLVVKSEGSPRRAMDTSFHEYFSYSKCLLKGQSTQS